MGSFREDGDVSHGFEIFFSVSSATDWAASFAAMARVRAIIGPCLGGAPSGVTPSKSSSISNCSISKRDVENLSDNKNVYQVTNFSLVLVYNMCI